MFPECDPQSICLVQTASFTCVSLSSGHKHCQQMCQVNGVSTRLKTGTPSAFRSLRSATEFSHVERVWLGSLLPRVASVSANHIFHSRGSGGVAQGHQSAAARQSIQTGHCSSVQQQGTAFHLQFPSLFCACVCSWFLQRGGRLAGSGTRERPFFSFFFL